ncbi:iron-containing alcohol dehydrogenase [Mycena pura]|uniref:Iron-containing alcohol dehydrogenase n=1 Tax=Mycena pura TaxID=153505 RepID=A0AAD6VL41_9AGAR|nr:iron-containing alcohol dehydrogenase [Mycena pura]
MVQYSKSTMHAPTNITDEAVELAQDLGADCVVAIGDLPQVVIPTSYSGVKTTQKSLKLLPEVIIYDVDLTLTIPTQMTITSGINAMAHAVESLYSTESNPITDALAEQGIARLAGALRILRSDALFGACACASCLGVTSMALHHKLCHTLGGTSNLLHSETHTVLLPHTIAYNTPFAVAAMPKLLGSSINLGAPYSLRQLGMKEEDLERAADVAMNSPYPNPAPLQREKILSLLRDAYEGKRPL